MLGCREICDDTQRAYHCPNLKFQMVLILITLQTVVHGIDTDHVVRVSSKEDASVGGPGQTGAGRDLSVSILFRTKSIDNNLALQVPDLDAVISGSTKPVTIGRKAEGVDDFSSIQGVQDACPRSSPKAWRFRPCHQRRRANHRGRRIQC